MAKQNSARQRLITIVISAISGSIFTAVIAAIVIISTQSNLLENANMKEDASQNENSTPHPVDDAQIRIENLTLPSSQQLFNDVLVVLHFNTPRYNHLPILLEHYGKVFKNIIVCGQQPHPMVDYVCTKDQVKNGGHLMYGCVADIMETYPNYAGYFSFHFDLLVNYWKFNNFDKNKAWISYTNDNSGPHPLSKFPNDSTKPSGWYWWGTKWGLAACRKAMKELPQQYKDKLIASYGANDVIWRGMGDLFYIPQRMRPEFVSLTRLFVKSEVFLEIAIPTIPIILEAPSAPLNLTGDFDWWSRRFEQYWKPEYQFAHPFRFHEYGMYAKFGDIMKLGYAAK